MNPSDLKFLVGVKDFHKENLHIFGHMKLLQKLQKAAGFENDSA